MSGWIEVRVAERRPLADGIVGFWLEGVEGPLPPFEAGDHVEVEVGPRVVRQYSLCGVPGEDGRYRLGVQREATGRGGSRAFCDGYGVGSTLRISRPRHRFPLVEDGSEVVLVAGGIGITPLMAMAWRLHTRGQPFSLHFCFRNRERAAFLDELAEAPFADRVHLHADDGSTGCPLDLAELVRERRGHLYCCGPAGFMGAVREAALAAGWPASSLHEESFSAAPVEHLASDGSFTVEARKSGVVLQVGPDESIADAARRQGLEPLLSCESGICGTCLTRVLAGTPDHRDHYQTAAEHESNEAIAICCSRSKTPVLALDL